MVRAVMPQHRVLRRPHTLLLAAACALALLAPSAHAAVPAPPGGPILVVTSTDGFGNYLPEILRAEGLNEFSVISTSQLSAQALSGASVVLLGAGSVTDAQAALLTSYVQGGGKLVASRPDPKLAPMLGLTAPAGALWNGYMAIDTSIGPGAGITGDSMQYHGAADRYGLAGARMVARLYATPSAATSNPAVTINSVGSLGGQAAAFTYDLARSVVYTRQGNPAWAGQERDNQQDPTAGNATSLRPDDLFFGAAPGDLQADWVDLGKVAIPQADEQQRLLANLLTQMSAERMPLPRFWYFPNGYKGAVVMTGDDHQPGQADTWARLNDFYSQSVGRNPSCATGASGHDAAVNNWQCILATSYIYPPGLTSGYTDAASMSQAQAQALVSAGYELAMHLRIDPSNSTQCVNFSSTAQLQSYMQTQLSEFAAATHWAGVIPAPTTIRTHCVIWADYSSQPAVDQAFGIRLNTDYYYWPRSWTQGRAGMFTGSGIPMRFADVNGGIFDVFQAPTQVPDETYLVGSTLTVDVAGVMAAINALLDNATGAPGYYGAFTVNMHEDFEPTDQQAADSIIASAISHGVPVISARQLLQWLDGRNASSYQNMSFTSSGVETFTIAPSSLATGLQAMVPTQGGGGTIRSLTLNGNPVSASTVTIKGVQYLTFPAAAGTYVATYPAPPTRGAPGGSPSQNKKFVTVRVLPRKTKAPTFPKFRRNTKKFRPGQGRAFTVIFRLGHKAKFTWTFRDRKHKVVRRIRTSKAYAKGTVLELRWDGKNTKGAYVKAGRYGFTITGSYKKWVRSAHSSIRVLKAKTK
jgi:hypothetical protein